MTNSVTLTFQFTGSSGVLGSGSIVGYDTGFTSSTSRPVFQATGGSIYLSSAPQSYAGTYTFRDISSFNSSQWGYQAYDPFFDYPTATNSGYAWSNKYNNDFLWEDNAPGVVFTDGTDAKIAGIWSNATNMQLSLYDNIADTWNDYTLATFNQATAPAISLSGGRGTYASVLNYKPIEVTVGGIQYAISYETGTKADLLTSGILQSQPWWGDSAKAAAFRDAYSLAIGSNGSGYYSQFWPNDSQDGDSAFFVYDSSGTTEMFYGSGQTLAWGYDGYFTWAKTVQTGAFNDPVVVDGNITLTAGSNSSLTSAQISVGSNYIQGEDLLTFNNTANIAGSWNQSTGVLTLSGTDTIQSYEEALESVKYSYIGTSATPQSRTISWQVYDGAIGSNLVTSVVNFGAAPQNPTVASATYDSATGVLVVTGTNLLASGGADIDVTKLTITAEGGTTYTLTSNTPNVEITSATAFSVTLGATDKAALNQLLNKNGTASTSGNTYNLAAADNWNPANTGGADTTNGITVSNVPIPAVTSATYDATTGVLVVTGTEFLKRDGAANDIDITKLSISGEGGASYTLTSASTANVEITSGTSFTVTLGATDKAQLNQILNKNGTSPTSGTPYNLEAAEDWAAGADAAVVVADIAGNGITVSNVPTPAITSATYNATTGALVVTGTGFLSRSGAQDINVSKLTFRGQGGGTRTLTSDDVEIASGTSFTVNLNVNDRTALQAIVNKNGTSSLDNTTYNLEAAEDWARGADAAVVIADLTGNGITVSNYVNSAPTNISLANATVAENAAVGTVVGVLATSDPDAGNTFTYSLVSGTGSTDNALFQIDGNVLKTNAVFDFETANTYSIRVRTADQDSLVYERAFSISVSDVNEAPTIASATYDGATGVLAVTGTNLLASSGADIDVTKLTVTAEGGATYTLTSDTPNVEITSATAFSVTLGATDKAALNQLLNKNGTASTSGNTYNLAAADNWNPANTGGADTTGNGITVSNVPAPAITSATYDATTGVLVVTGTGFLKRNAVADIDVTKLTISGQGGSTRTLTSSGVEITSGTSFSVTLNDADKTVLLSILNQNGTTSQGGTTYNLAAAEDWAAGADAAVVIADLTGNGITVANYVAPAQPSTDSEPRPVPVVQTTPITNIPTETTTSPQNPSPDSPVLGIQPQQTVTTVQLQTPLTIGNQQFTQAVVGTERRDTVTGSNAGEVMAGVKEKDRLTGNGGPDAFLFESPGEFGRRRLDIVTDFKPSERDKVAVAQEVFNGITQIQFQAVNGRQGARAAAGTKKNIVYDQRSGIVYFNANGSRSGWGDGGEFVKLLGAPEIGKGDFAIV